MIKTWTLLQSTLSSNFLYVNKMGVSPNDQNVLYAATRAGVFKSTDQGTSFSQVLTMYTFKKDIPYNVALLDLQEYWKWQCLEWTTFTLG